MGRKAKLGALALVHWDAAEAGELAGSLRSAGWRVNLGLGEWSAVKAKPPLAVLISLRRLPSHGREVADALWYTQWGRAIPIVFFDGQADKVEATRTRFPEAKFAKWAELPALLQQMASKPQARGMVRRGAQQNVGPIKAKPKQPADGRVTVENVNVPGYTTKVDAAKYAAMRRAILAVLPRAAPGLTQAEIRRAVVAHLPEELFPNGAKAAWWAKIVQLDLEAKKIVIRDVDEKPLRWRKASARAQ